MTAAVAGRYRTAQDKVTRASLAPAAVLLDSVPVGVPLTPQQWARVVAAVFTPVSRGRAVSRDLAADLYSTLSPSGRAPVLPARAYDLSALAAGLEPVREKLADPDLHGQGLVQGMSVVSRHVEMAGRDYHRQATYADDTAKGWARVARGARTCAFCLMLISRGPCYKSGATAGLNDDGTMNAWHIRCDCQAVPVFDLDDWVGKEQFERAQQLWVDVTNDYDGRDKLNAFRAAVEQRRPLAADDKPVEKVNPSDEVALAHSSALPDPDDIPDNEMDAALSAAIEAEDWDRFEALSAVSDARDEAREAEKAKAEKRAKESAARADRRRRAKERVEREKFERMDALIEAGWGEEEAYIEAYGVDADAIAEERAVDMLKGYAYTGKTFETLARQSYKDYLEAAYLEAEQDCRGHLRRARSARANVSTKKLFSGNLAYAKAHASEELLEWWERNGRRTFEEHKLMLLGDVGGAAKRRVATGIDRDR